MGVKTPFVLVFGFEISLKGGYHLHLIVVPYLNSSWFDLHFPLNLVTIVLINAHGLRDKFVRCPGVEKHEVICVDVAMTCPHYLSKTDLVVRYAVHIIMFT